jgi:hypothetical protein
VGPRRPLAPEMREQGPLRGQEAFLLQQLQAERRANQILARQNQQLRDRLPQQLSTEQSHVDDEVLETAQLLGGGGSGDSNTGGCCCGICDDILRQRVPSVQEATGLFCMILNVFLPGTGSILAGVSGNRPSTVLLGLLQLVFAATIVGWFFSIWWGYLIYRRSRFHESDLVNVSIYTQPFRSGGEPRTPSLSPRGRSMGGDTALAHTAAGDQAIPSAVLSDKV